MELWANKSFDTELNQRGADSQKTFDFSTLKAEILAAFHSGYDDDSCGPIIYDGVVSAVYAETWITISEPPNAGPDTITIAVSPDSPTGLLDPQIKMKFKVEI